MLNCAVIFKGWNSQVLLFLERISKTLESMINFQKKWKDFIPFIVHIIMVSSIKSNTEMAK